MELTQGEIFKKHAKNVVIALETHFVYMNLNLLVFHVVTT